MSKEMRLANQLARSIADAYENIQDVNEEILEAEGDEGELGAILQHAWDGLEESRGLIADFLRKAEEAAAKAEAKAEAEKAEEMKRQAMEQAVEKASQEFWRSIAFSYPQARSGDLHPEQVVKFEDAACEAVQKWVEENVDADKSPESPEISSHNCFAILDIDGKTVSESRYSTQQKAKQMLFSLPSMGAGNYVASMYDANIKELDGISLRG